MLLAVVIYLVKSFSMVIMLLIFRLIISIQIRHLSRCMETIATVSSDEYDGVNITEGFSKEHSLDLKQVMGG